MSAAIEVRAPRSPAEYSAAYDLVERVYRRHGYCAYLEDDEQSPSILVAVEDRAIIGTIGMRSGEDGQLPIEYYFGFDTADVYSGPRSTVVEICKLASSGRCDLVLVKSLVAAVSQYCAENPELEMVYFSEKPALAQLMRRFLRMPLVTLPFPVAERHVNRLYAGYFLTDPRPVPLMIHTRELPQFFPQLLADIEGKATIDLGGFEHRSRDVVRETLESPVALCL